MFDVLMAKASEYVPKDRLKIIEEAYEFAEIAHNGQLRASGGPFIAHPLETALTLADLKLDANALAAALLHDVVEDVDDIELDDISKRFGPEIAGLVDGVTKLTRADLVTAGSAANPEKGRAQAETIRKMLVAMAEDIRVVLIKLADRLHNMKTLDALDPEKRIEKAQETFEIYAPLAHRLGIWEIKWQLEDLSFQQIEPAAYKQISRMLNTKRGEREEYIRRILGILQTELEDVGIRAEVTGRPKHIYSIHRKAQKYAADRKTTEDIYDLFALRVLVDEVKDCYAALGAIHNRWRPLPGQFDDYIANPKDNLYQSIHTTVLCEDGNPVEVQIRTLDMHSVAEYGVAAHWLYKEGRAKDAQFDQKMTWLRQLLEWQRDVSGAEEFVESFKTDIFQNQVFVYTPLGDLKEMPAGATPLDFAFRIHSDLIFRCIGAKVNGRLVPLTYQLKNGDTVQILTSNTVRSPSLDWLNLEAGYIKTASARARVRQWFNRQERHANVQRGRDIYQKQLKRLTTTMSDADVSKIMGVAKIEDFFAALGDGSITVALVASKLTRQEEDDVIEIKDAMPLPSIMPTSAIEVLGVGDLLTSMARCCNPIHGDEIIGYITRSRGVNVHRRTCPNILHESEQERLVQVGWGQTQTLYPVRIQVRSWDRVGLLGDITSLVSDEKVNIASIVSEEYADMSIITLTVHISGIDQLSRVFLKLEGVKGVIGVTRVSS
ncbi:MAG: bifunctional (p)ppGpp synthetase/guanosine-3',5'-bis(diphosphate) 3'-pyrophosphohydrolase [SAR202 cluster bacterium]|jgi:GTP pyrophosphokinase|nr:bifunctional (p)ppGpp synthetase/guanosine-3',5'-bis(diphosphate) 3'-pyrophosphohydrolase [SAR202 cluster bacterium]MDP7104550.1 bifunctional (p)ppGpp synthetase/guanosine-3',5'-bis(diphosphate) 3'-pyrophosphohydrolase [SAR202 cluster bacterium]MDP7226181.1 bifunctional (p)ppGpp synthetase/guanosine-3',5'-bis(diphosphate) 3'-pyrophosphohydrolase [SAR202 cluster bacterium]MDP7414436.1 bifunctional (p)ppGpp synthetase/guanosine-3',5'-bis(diphosphate) 3'-pyrophosphohydrolase [SAR202 cluster bact|tara:strand:+ start:1635 stop:3788 length:2154 start_codon:yes stop_codon:yes gene_type:complete